MHAMIMPCLFRNLNILSTILLIPFNGVHLFAATRGNQTHYYHKLYWLMNDLV